MCSTVLWQVDLTLKASMDTTTDGPENSLKILFKNSTQVFLNIEETVHPACHLN